MANEIKIETSGGTITVRSPYDASFVAAARQRGGKWQGGKWVFDARDEAAVRAICLRVYGTDGDLEPETVTCRVELDAMRIYGDELTICGRQAAKRWGRDSIVKLAPGVVVVAGSFPDTGGSRKRPELYPRPGTVLEIRDVPRAVAERARDEYGDEVISIIEDAATAIATDTTPPPPPIVVELVRAEAEALLELARAARLDGAVAALAAALAGDQMPEASEGKE